ncbi:MAG: hypothetical protein WA624_01775 [Methylocella sp.]
MGFKLYGFGAEAGRIAHDISIGASHFLLNQLPELYTAFQRDETTFPVQYVGANVPQAWAAGSISMLTQAMLGFLPDAPRNKLYDWTCLEKVESFPWMKGELDDEAEGIYARV